MSEAPKAPWSPFPLVELCVLLALVLTGLPQIALLAVGALVYTLGFVALRRAFQARTGGIGAHV
jgi:hypothetical protein